MKSDQAVESSRLKRSRRLQLVSLAILTLVSFLLFSDRLSAQQPLPGVDYPEHIFRSVIPLPVGETATDVHVAGFHAYPLREVYRTSRYSGWEYTGYRSFQGTLYEEGVTLREHPQILVRVGGTDHILELDDGQAEHVSNIVTHRRYWEIDVSPGIVTRVWLTDYAGDDWELALLVSNSEAHTPLRDRQIAVRVDEGETQSGLMPPTYGKAFRMGSRAPEEFVRSFWLDEGVGLIGYPSRNPVTAVYDGNWVDLDEHFGFWHPIGVRYGGMTGGLGVHQFQGLFSVATSRDFIDQVRYHDRMSMELEFERFDSYGNTDVFDYRFLRGDTGNFQFADPQRYREPKSGHDIRSYQSIDFQHTTRAMRYDVGLGLRYGDPLACHWLIRFGDWADMKWENEVGSPMTVNGGRSWGRASAWGLKALACKTALLNAKGAGIESHSLPNAIRDSALASGLFQAEYWGKLATDPPYNGNYFAGRSQEQLFHAGAMLEWGITVGDESHIRAARNCLRGLLDVCWWAEGTAGFADRYAVGTRAGGPTWTSRQLDYPNIGGTIFHDSYDSGNIPALLLYARDAPHAVEALGRVAGTIDIVGALQGIGSSATAPANTSGARLGSSPYSNFGMSYEVLWGLQ